MGVRGGFVDEVFPEGLNRICMCVCIAMGTVAIPYLAESAAVSSCPKPERSTAFVGLSACRQCDRELTPR